MRLRAGAALLAVAAAGGVFSVGLLYAAGATAAKRAPPPTTTTTTSEPLQRAPPPTTTAGKPDLLLVRAETRPEAELSADLRWAWRRTAQWAAARGLGVVNYVDHDVPPYWAKVKALRAHLDDAHAVLFLDTDAVPAALGCGVRDVTGLLLGGAELVSAPDPNMWSGRFNAGVLLLRSTPRMRQLLDYWLSLYQPQHWTRKAGQGGGPPTWSTWGSWAGPFYEQGSFSRHVLGDPRFAGVHRRVSWEAFNQYDHHARTNTTLFYHFPDVLKSSRLPHVRAALSGGGYDEACAFDARRAVSKSAWDAALPRRREAHRRRVVAAV